MRQIFALLILLSLSGILSAQEDTYHSTLRTMLQTKYGITGGSWVFSSNEVTNATNISGGGGTRTLVNIAGQSFTKATQLAITKVPANGWDAGMQINNSQPIANGDRLLVIFWARTISAPNRIGLGNFEFMMNSGAYTKYMTFEQRVGSDWKQFILPVQVTADFAVGKAKFGVELGVAIQTVQIAGVTAINYKQIYALSALPVKSNDEYVGMESNAPWRAAADARIEQYRKSNMEISVLNSSQQPLPNVQVKVEMLRHEYAFGTAINETKIAGNKSQDNTYQNKLFNLDGKGHGFSEVVFENGHKWPAWDGNWNLTKAQKAATVKWLTNRGIRVRGHNLVWPGWSNSPTDLKDHVTDLAYLNNRINTHLAEVLNYPDMKGLINDWDVINEPTGNVDIANTFKGSPGYLTGREIYVNILNKVKQIAPEVKKYINEANYTNFYSKNDDYKSYVKEIVDGGATIDGIGFQAHFSYMIPPEEMYGYYDEFHNITGGLVKITEYDTKTFAPDSMEAAYFRDLLNITFSHPYSDGFIMWGFWDGAHYSGRAPLFDKNWNLKPGGKPFIDLVFDKWWTPTSTLVSDASGKSTLRGFKGTYKITITTGAEIFVDTVRMKDDLNLKYTQPFSKVTGLSELKTQRLNIYPNPSSQNFMIERGDQSACQVALLSMKGQKIKSFSSNERLIPVDTVGLVAGVYVVEVSDKTGVSREKIMVK